MNKKKCGNSDLKWYIFFVVLEGLTFLPLEGQIF